MIDNKEKDIWILVQGGDEDGNEPAYQAKSQMDNCPGCGKFEHLEILNITMDDPAFEVLCRPCQWFTTGETIAEAIENWNTRYEAAAHSWIAIEERLPEYFGTYIATVQDPDELIVMDVWFDRVEQEFKTNDRFRQDPGKVIAWMPLPQPFTK